MWPVDLNDAGNVPALLSEYLCAYSRTAEAPYGVFLNDSRSSALTRIIHTYVIPKLEEQGTRVAICDLKHASTAAAPSLVHDVLRVLFGSGCSESHMGERPSGKGRYGAYCVDHYRREAVSTMVLAAVGEEAPGVVLIINAVERLLHGMEGRSLVAGLQHASELVRLRGEAAGHFMLVGIGTDDAVLDRLAVGSFRPARERQGA